MAPELDIAALLLGHYCIDLGCTWCHQCMNVSPCVQINLVVFIYFFWYNWSKWLLVFHIYLFLCSYHWTVVHFARPCICIYGLLQSWNASLSLRQSQTVVDALFPSNMIWNCLQDSIICEIFHCKLSLSISQFSEPFLLFSLVLQHAAGIKF